MRRRISWLLLGRGRRGILSRWEGLCGDVEVEGEGSDGVHGAESV